jgi:hypothetical protein
MAATSDDLTTLDLPDLERRLHDALGRWAEDHAQRYPDIGVLAYDPASAEQQIGTAKSSTSDDLCAVPRDELGPLLQRGYERSMGTACAAIARQIDECLGDSLQLLLREGKSVAVLTSHAERLDDIGAVAGAIALALGDASLIGRNATILNKVMSRESYKGAPIATLFRHFGNVYWVIPDTESATRFGISPELSRRVNGASMRALVADMRSGVVLTFAPSGSAMRQELAPDGETARLVIPPVAPGTAKLISRFDAYVVATVWKGELRLGPLVPIPARGTPEADPARVLSEALATMAQLTSELAGIPVDYVPPR